MSDIRSAPLRSGPRTHVVTEVASALPWRLAGVGALLVGFALWLIGARFTVLGGPRVLSILFGSFGIDMAIVLPGGWWFLALTIAVGAIVSSIEFGCRPRRSFFSKSLLLGFALVLLWVLFNSADWLSTFVGVTTPQFDSWPITIWMATAPIASITWTTFLTYCPELLMIAGGRWLVSGRF